jgi:DNA-directed RNA polymerase specialized sigma24 family protein
LLTLVLALAQIAPVVQAANEIAITGEEREEPWLRALAWLSQDDLTRQKLALEQLRQLHRHLLGRFQLGSLPEHTREKLFSDYLLRLWTAWERHSSGEPHERIRSVYGLSRRIVHSTVVDDLRSRTRGILGVEVAELASEPTVPEPDDFDLARRLGEMPTAWRDALEATLRNGSVRAAAEELGISTAQVRYRVDRAREGLRS